MGLRSAILGLVFWGGGAFANPFVVPYSVEIWPPLRNLLSLEHQLYFLQHLDRAVMVTSLLTEGETRTPFHWDADQASIQNKSLRLYLTLASDPYISGTLLPTHSTSGLRVQTRGPEVEITLFLLLDRIFYTPAGLAKAEPFIDMLHPVIANLVGGASFFLELSREQLDTPLNILKREELRDTQARAVVRLLGKMKQEERFAGMSELEKIRVTQLLAIEKDGLQNQSCAALLN